MELIEDTGRFYIFQWEYDGLPITFRKWRHTDEFVEIRVNENFARANGYESVSDMIAKTVGEAKMRELFGGIPDWIKAFPDGEFAFVGRDIKTLN